MIREAVLFIGQWGALVYLIALDFMMLSALARGSATLIPDALLPLEAFIIVPFSVIVTASTTWGTLRVLRSH